MVAIVDVLPRAKLSQMLSPISFLAAKDLPREVTNFRFKGEQTIRGHKTLFVSCQGNAQFLESMKPVKEAVLEKGEFGLYIDPVTNLLVKAVGIIAWKVQLPAQGKQPAKVGRQIIIFEETHAGTVLNPPLKPEEFLFDPPKGAKEVFSESK